MVKYGTQYNTFFQDNRGRGVDAGLQELAFERSVGGHLNQWSNQKLPKAPDQEVILLKKARGEKFIQQTNFFLSSKSAQQQLSWLIHNMKNPHHNMDNNCPSKIVYFLRPCLAKPQILSVSKTATLLSF